MLTHTIHKALNFLAKDQQPDGSFLCLVSETFDDYIIAETVPAIVPSNVVLSSLVHLPQTELVREICKKIAHFLLQEKNSYWSFNYWFRRSDWYTKEPYPDDTDDTFCALAALYKYDSTLFDGDTLAKITIMLTSAEKKIGGPYDMWLVPESGRATWNDTDLICNANIAYFLHLQDITLPSVTEFIEQKIEKGEYEIPYNTIYPAIYFISRFYKGEKMQVMIDLLLSKQENNGVWENPLRTALAVSALLNFGVEPTSLSTSIQYLEETQNTYGSWPAYSFYYQMKTKGKTLFAGSASITTALCVEALNKYEKYISGTHTKVLPVESKNNKTELLDCVKKRFTSCSVDVQKQSVEFISQMLDKDKDGDITGVHMIFQRNLKKQHQSKLAAHQDTLEDLGAAHVYGWMAYTIYDDFLDGEYDATLLSVAHVCLRESYSLFTHIAEKYGAAEFVKNIFDTIDSANMWESLYCRGKNIEKYTLPDFGNLQALADKSIGHALSTLILFLMVGIQTDSEDFKHLYKFFQHYIIARQLNDDAHDWQEDMEKGQITPVVLRVLKGEDFWQETIMSVCGDIKTHIDFAREELHAVSALDSGEEIASKLLKPIYSSAEKALVERENMMSFLKAYQAVS